MRPYCTPGMDRPAMLKTYAGGAYRLIGHGRLTGGYSNA